LQRSHLTGCWNLPKRIAFWIAALVMLLPSPIWAADGIDQLRQEIRAFLNSPEHEFAPETAEKAQAYLGAAMLAREKHDEENVHQSLEAARRTLSEARRLASDFRKKNSELLKLRAAAREAADSPNDPALQAAEQNLKKMIQATEKGLFNQSEQFKQKATRAYRDIIDRRLPALVEETGKLISRAAAAGAKKYAPRTYQGAKQWLSEASAYVDGISRKVPDHPRRGIRLATAARELALQVKQWRKHAGSHEQLVLKGRKERLRLASKLGLDVHPDDPTADISLEAILAEIDKRQARQKTYALEVEKVREQCQRELEKKLAEQRETLLSRQQERLSSLKDAFRAKLERETFEKKRQQRLRKIFRKGDVDIYYNLDGSILIRLSRLKFAPGRSSIDKKYYDLLARLKEALEIYGDRNVNIEGHTDNKGEAKPNQVLSLKRAESVRDYLISAGVEAGRLKALGYGEVRPIASNDYEKGRAMNRRIDVIILPPNG